jgi:hypothetical protein
LFKLCCQDLRQTAWWFTTNALSVRCHRSRPCSNRRTLFSHIQHLPIKVGRAPDCWDVSCCDHSYQRTIVFVVKIQRRGLPYRMR